MTGERHRTIGQCDYHDPATGKRCTNTGLKLRLVDDLGHPVSRILCRDHSDWMEHRDDD